MSISQHTFPSKYKFATLVPLKKKASLDRQIFKNYRPVSNLEYVGKLIEKVVVDQVSTYRESNGLNPVFQSAYRKHHSCETALVCITNEILMAMDLRQCVALVMLDLSAAFDTVSHPTLLRRLEEDFGVRGSALLWFESYFSGRSQAVNIQGTLSQPKPLTTGMPQGSRVGPTEFPSYTSPVFTIAEKHGVSIHVYADDTQLYLPFNPTEYETAMCKLQDCVEEIRLWLASNHLKLNEDKTEFLVIGSKPQLRKIGTKCSFKIGNEIIQASKKAKNIGAVLDENMEFRAHVDQVARSCYLHLRNIAHIRPFINEDTAATLVHAFISSKLDNLNSILAGVPQTIVKKLQLIQNNAARLVKRKKRHDHVTPILQELHWLPVKMRIQYKICLLTHKALHGSAPEYISNMLTRHVPLRNLRSAHSNRLVIQVPNLKNTGGRAFSVQAPKLWNALPDDVRLCNTLDMFKSKLKTHLFREAYS